MQLRLALFAAIACGAASASPLGRQGAAFVRPACFVRSSRAALPTKQIDFGLPPLRAASFPGGDEKDAGSEEQLDAPRRPPLFDPGTQRLPSAEDARQLSVFLQYIMCAGVIVQLMQLGKLM